MAGAGPEGRGSEGQGPQGGGAAGAPEVGGPGPEPAGPVLRVVSLVPSVSETLVAWGLVPVAVTRFCEQPGLPTVGGTKTPDVGAILRLAPDLVVMDREENRREDAEALAAGGLTLHVTDVRSVADVAPALAALRTALGMPPPAPAGGGPPAPGWSGAAVSPDPPLDTALHPHPLRAPLRAWIPIWRRPWMTVNDRTYGASLLAACGATNIFGDHPDTYPQVEIEEVEARRPDVVLAPSEPYPWGERHRDLLGSVAPVVLVDGRDVFWWGQRTPLARARLAARLAEVRRRGASG